MVNKFGHIVFLVVILAPGLTEVHAQTGKVSAAVRKQEKAENEREKAYEQARKKTLKHRREIQTEATKKRMDVVHKKARAYNKQNDVPWYRRYFGRRYKK